MVIIIEFQALRSLSHLRIAATNCMEERGSVTAAFFDTTALFLLLPSLLWCVDS